MIRKYKTHSHAVCSDCDLSYIQLEKKGETVDAWAKRHVRETGHITTIEESHDVADFSK